MLCQNDQVAPDKKTARREAGGDDYGAMSLAGVRVLTIQPRIL